jgi:predicted secreted protein
MTWYGALATYFVIWWIALFAILPLGIKSQVENDDVVPGSEPGAPARPMLLKKAILTTVVSLPLLGLVWLWNVYERPI